jgi:hypothetical protein
MADKQSRLAEIYKAEKERGGGVFSTLGKRAKEKFDPRQMFNQKGFAAAALPSFFKAYDAVGKTKKIKELSESGQGGFSSAVLENGISSLITETRQVKIHSQLAAKNSVVLPSMARDMNVTRQNMVKLVKLQGGNATTKADMFFKRAGDREAAYESKFKKASDTTPTKAGAAPKEEEKKGILGSIIDGISSLFTMKGALITGILAAITLGINEYFTNDEFKTKVDSFLGDMFRTIKDYFIQNLPVIIDFMKDHWKELALAFALLFPKTTMDLIAGGLNVLSSGLNLLASAVKILLPLIEVTLVTAFRSLIALLTGPAGLIILLGGALFAARKLFDQNQEEYLKLAKEKKEKGTLSEKDEARLKELNSPTNEAAAEKQLGYNPISGKLVTQQEANRSMAQRSLDSRTTDNQLKDIATEQLMDEATKAGKDPNNITNKDIETRFQLLKKQRDSQNAKESAQRTAAAPDQSNAETARLANAGKSTTAAAATGAPATTSPTPASVNIPGSAKEKSKTPTIEKFDYTKYKELVGQREGGGKYDADNKVGFVGKYQFGAQALETFGYLKAGTSADRNAVYNPSNWTGKNGISSADDFKKASDIQENLMGAYTDMNLKGLQKSGVITGEDAGSAIASKLYAAHHGGVGGASKFFKENKDTKDFAFSSASVGKSAALMATAYETGQIGGAEYSGLGGASGTTVASAANPTQQSSQTPSMASSLGSMGSSLAGLASSVGTSAVTSIAANAPNMGNAIDSASTGLSEVMRMFDNAMASVTNITNNSTQASAAPQSQGKLPSVYDDTFANLFQRVA